MSVNEFSFIDLKWRRQLDGEVSGPLCRTACHQTYTTVFSPNAYFFSSNGKPLISDDCRKDKSEGARTVLCRIGHDIVTVA